MNRNTLLALGVFVALGAVVLLTQQKVPEHGITRISFKDVDPMAVDRIEITGAKSVVLVRLDETWTVDGVKKANVNFITQLTEALPKVYSSHLVTNNTTRAEELGVDEEKGHRVVAKVGDKIVADFVIGKGAAGGVHVRVDDQTYLVNGLSAYVFTRTRDQWFRLEVLSEVDRDNVERLEVHGADTDYVLVRVDGAWELDLSLKLPLQIRQRRK